LVVSSKEIGVRHDRSKSNLGWALTEAAPSIVGGSIHIPRNWW